MRGRRGCSLPTRSPSCTGPYGSGPPLRSRPRLPSPHRALRSVDPELERGLEDAPFSDRCPRADAGHALARARCRSRSARDPDQATPSRGRDRCARHRCLDDRAWSPQCLLREGRRRVPDRRHDRAPVDTRDLRPRLLDDDASPRVRRARASRSRSSAPRRACRVSISSRPGARTARAHHSRSTHRVAPRGVRDPATRCYMCTSPSPAAHTETMASDPSPQPLVLEGHGLHRRPVSLA